MLKLSAQVGASAWPLKARAQVDAGVGRPGNLIEPDMLTRVYGVQVEAARTRDGRPVFALAAAAAPRGVG